MIALPWAVLGCAATLQPKAIGPSSREPSQLNLGSWSEQTLSPRPAALNSDDTELLSACERIDGGLVKVARRLAEHQATTHRLMDNDEISFELRAAGVPQVWPRAWGAQGLPGEMDVKQDITAWLASFADGGERRCGIGRARTNDGQEIIAVVALDALADLTPVTRVGRTGQWISIDAQLHEPATDADVIVLGPRGAPRSIPSTLRGNRITARMALAEPGQWTLQVLPTFGSGPRPALEATIFADQAPPRGFHATPAPGEKAALGVASGPLAMQRMLNEARASEGLRLLARDERLERAAASHARQMLLQRRVAHDLGAGTPLQRIQNEGLSPSIAGENVARASTVQRAHRALWASPSHRGNVLDGRFTHVGISVEVADDGSVWVCQVFAALPG